ncbi:MarR family transcriptional regulator [Streptomyces sp. MBT42]|uniref:GbsR/MarR family transcriptional regulator n=1 Tax=Streptomyces sp. MBT42 TaxID=1488373 RepID=UPI001E501230|nr:helix-turn-helix domain-containing protein [Streptomyces sp. MBT42]MCD2468637.1 MarR family transcriptional regulator [Streptomyces sp. MBT42]
MPGGRLTHQDRRHIAEGLAAGLTPTEIAVRLERPLSTITREVTRNGGPDGYRADQAQRATEERARRRRPTSVPTPKDLTPETPGGEAVHALEEQFTAIMIGTGLPRMTARVLTCLYLTDSGSLSAAELVQRLRVSPASVSKAIGELEQHELIRRDRDPRQRRDHYVIDAEAWFRGWMASARQNTALADFARMGAETLGATTPAGARLRDIGDFFEHVGHAMLQAAEQWRQNYTARRSHAAPET